MYDVHTFFFSSPSPYSSSPTDAVLSLGLGQLPTGPPTTYHHPLPLWVQPIYKGKIRRSSTRSILMSKHFYVFSPHWRCRRLNASSQCCQSVRDRCLFEKCSSKHCFYFFCPCLTSYARIFPLPESGGIASQCTTISDDDTARARTLDGASDGSEYNRPSARVVRTRCGSQHHVCCQNRMCFPASYSDTTWRNIITVNMWDADMFFYLGHTAMLWL